MKRVITFAMFFVALVFGSQAFAKEQVEACLKYSTREGWSRAYSVNAKVLDGMDLNDAVGSYSRFKSFATYAVVFWGQGEASIFELPYRHDLPFYYIEVKDQTGRLWQIREGGGYCY